MKKVLIVFGTRPEAIKMAPLVMALKLNKEEFDTRVCVTAQHRDMLDQVLAFFAIKPDYDLDLMKQNQNLYGLSSDILIGMKSVLDEFMPEIVLVHGDTTTSMIAALAAFYNGAKICHVEAGLRTNNKRAPYPEEMNRQITGRLADFHFAPTVTSKNNLLNEGVGSECILVTGNTVIDALLFSANRVESFEGAEIGFVRSVVPEGKKVILVTGHRRENHGDGVIAICNALKQIALNNLDVFIVYPVHLNPNIKEPVHRLLGDIENIKLIEPLGYPAFVWLMKISYMIITDSGGIQEEAPSLGKPVLVMRSTTERPEAVESGTVKLVGTDESKIVEEAEKLLTDSDYYTSMSQAHNPYGDGLAAERIVEFIKTIK